MKNITWTSDALDCRDAGRTLELVRANEQLKDELALCRQSEHELRKAVAAAKAANEAKTLFLGNMSHELRTPLNAIIGFSEVIQSELFGPAGNAKYAEYAKDINQSGIHLLRLINDLLDVSRIEAGRLALSEEVFDLTCAIVASLHMLRDQAVARRVFLSHDIPADFPFMHGDQTRIKQIFINLIGNAIKFTPAGGSVRVSASVLDDAAMRIIVADTGIGIAPDDLMKVCETYGQVANSLTRAHEGAGLGLPLAKALTGRHGGTLEITSEVGRGTTITVIFPASLGRARKTVSGNRFHMVTPEKAVHDLSRP